MKTGIDIITQERDEHFSKHGYTIEQDAAFNANCELVTMAKVLLAFNDDDRPHAAMVRGADAPGKWNPVIVANMVRKPYLERLAIAGSFIAAEIDRILYEDGQRFVAEPPPDLILIDDVKQHQLFLPKRKDENPEIDGEDAPIFFDGFNTCLAIITERNQHLSQVTFDDFGDFDDDGYQTTDKSEGGGS